VSSLTLTDAVPAALLNPVFGTPSAGSYNPATGVWSGLSLVAGQSVTITLTGTIDPSATGTLTNTATVAPPAGVTDPNPANNNASDIDTLTPQADLAITKTDGVTSAVPGSSTTYTIVVSNLGPSAVTGASVADSLPAGATGGSWAFAGMTGGGAVTGPSSGSGALATTVDLPVNATITFTFTVQVSPSATGTLDNTATITAPAGVTDTNPANNSATDTDTLTPQGDLAITKTDGVTSVVPGTPNTYTIVVSNSGPSDVTGASVADPLPAGVTSGSWTATASSGGGAVTGPSSGAGALATTVDLPVGASVTFTFTVQVDPSATGTLDNTATVTVPAGVTDPNPANNSATDSDTLTPQADLAITKDDGVLTVAPGGTTTYTIVVSNAGPSTAVDQVVTDSFPSAITAVSWTAVASAGSSVANASGTGNIATTVTLLPGGSVTFTAVSQISSSATGTLTNTATVAVPPGDTTPADNSASDTDSLAAQADLALAKTVTNSAPNLGDIITYTITLTNNGPDTATGVQVSEPLSASLALVNASPSQGSYNTSTGVWVVGTLADGAHAVLTLEAQVVSRAPLTNTAAISAADQFDSNPGNNQASVTVVPPVQPIVPPTLLGKVLLVGSNMSIAAADAVFVNHLYQDLLGRAPDLPGLNFWFGLLLAGVPRGAVTQEIWQSPEHYGIEVDRFYQIYLHRSADLLGRQAWVNALLAGAGETAVEQGFVASAEYTADHPDDAGFVTSLYYAVLGRTPSASEVAGWQQVLQNGASRAAVALGFLTSQEADLRLLDQYYEGYLGRAPDPAGEQFWLGLLQDGALTPQAVGQSILASDEYFSRSP
jgi:uncharacterized repeat protein (TIGR01451 family)